MPITYTASVVKLSVLVTRLRNGRLAIPDHQRDFCWSMRQQQTLATCILRPKPVPSILIREKDDNSTTLEDGRQRLETAARYTENQFNTIDGRFFTDLTDLERERWSSYDVVVITYSGATDQEAREIFNDTQNGKPLTFGERIFSLSATSPIVTFATRTLLTPGQGLHDSFAPYWGVHRSAQARRGADMTKAFALCAGFAFGIEHLSTKWDDATVVLHRDFDEHVVITRLNILLRVYREMAERVPVTTKALQSTYYDIGNFTGYIAFSIMVQGDPMNFRRLAAMLAPAIPDRNSLVNRWVDFMVAQREQPGLLLEILHRDLSLARSWNRSRWQNGVRRLLVPDSFAQIPADENLDDDDDA